MENVNTVVLPVEEWVWMSIRETRCSLNEAGLDHKRLSDDFFKDCVINIIEDALRNRSLWAKPSGYLERYLDATEWFRTGIDFCDIIYASLELVVIPRIYDTVETFIPEEPHHFWILKKLNSKNFYVAERSEDYRISEYYRLKREYEPDDIIDDSMCLANCVLDEGGEIQDYDYAFKRIEINRQKRKREEYIDVLDDF